MAADFETVNFALDGTNYEIALPRTESAAFRSALNPYIQAARTTDRLDQLESFVAATGRLPSYHAPSERRLYAWMSNVRAGRTKSTPEIRDRVDALADAARTAAELNRLAQLEKLEAARTAAEVDRLAQLEKLVATTGRLPSRAALAERSLFGWASSVRAGRTKSAPGTRHRVDELFAAARTAVEVDRLAQLENLVATTGRLPSQTTLAERSLYNWMSSVRAGRAKCTPETRDRVDELCRATPRLPTPGRYADHRVEELDAFFTTNHRFPRIRSADPTERALAEWLGKAKTVGRKLTDAAAGKLLEILGRPEQPTDDPSAADLIDFITRVGRLPRHERLIPQEMQLARWYRNYQLGKCTVTPHTALVIDEAVAALHHTEPGDAASQDQAQAAGRGRRHRRRNDPPWISDPTYFDQPARG